MAATPAEMYLAVMEGVAFAIRDSLEVAKSLCGGAKSPLWRKIMANVLNIRIDIPETEEGPGSGRQEYLEGVFNNILFK